MGGGRRETVQYRLLKQLIKAKEMRERQELERAGIHPSKPSLPKLTEEERKKFDEDFEKLVQEIVGKKVL